MRSIWRCLVLSPRVSYPTYSPDNIIESNRKAVTLFTLSVPEMSPRFE